LISVTLLFTKLRLGLDPEKDAPLRHIHKIAPRPLLLIQGDSDLRMPPSEGERLYARAQEPKTLWTVPGADHGEVSELTGAEYQDRLLEFFKTAFEKDAENQKAG
jgi:fermentation-respiration switch protein FrsA (DUF1100 family)